MGLTQAHAEVWRDIPGYEGQYQVSSTGNVRSLDRSVHQISRYGLPMVRKLRGQILRLQKYPNGYLFVQLGKNNPQLAHRLVAHAFLGTDDNLQVNHKNGIRADNRVENLELVTCSENHLHSYRELPRKEHALIRRVRVVKGTLVFEFNSALSAAKTLGVRPGSISSAALRGHRCRGCEVIYESQ